MKTILAVIMLASRALAQDPDATTRSTTACGPINQHYEVKIDKKNHPLAQPEPGKALVYVIEDDQSGSTTFWGISAKVTTRLGLDGKWVGVNRGNSYFFLSVDPGTLHLCADLPPDLYQAERGLVSVTRFTAEPGKTYYLRIRVTSSPVCVSKCDGLRTGLELETVDEDKGQLLVASSRFSTSHAEDW